MRRLGEDKRSLLQVNGLVDTLVSKGARLEKNDGSRRL